MPTNILRNRPAAPQANARGGTAIAPRRTVVIRAGRVAVRAELAATPTADRIWAALPIFSTAETWGASLHFEIPVESGRDRTARTTARIGDVYFWSGEERILIVFGRTPISRAGEVRLPSPCNVWATAIDDVTPLKDIAPGEKVSVAAD